jgi:hypothetical protein
MEKTKTKTYEQNAKIESKYYPLKRVYKYGCKYGCMDRYTDDYSTVDNISRRHYNIWHGENY